jgi:hypothetical protein
VNIDSASRVNSNSEFRVKHISAASAASFNLLLSAVSARTVSSNQ